MERESKLENITLHLIFKILWTVLCAPEELLASFLLNQRVKFRYPQPELGERVTFFENRYIQSELVTGEYF